jgi:hypothetical protein
MVMARTGKETARYWLRRLNVFLQFARVDPWTLSNGAFERLRDQMFLAVEGHVANPVARKLVRGHFDLIATRQALREAYDGLNDAIEGLLVIPKTGLAQFVPRFKLVGQELTIFTTNDGFAVRLDTKHFPSQVYKAFADALEASGVKPSDFLHCSYCNNLFVPLRKPRKGTPVYCSPKCANVIASRDYRARQAEMRERKKKPK